MDDEHFESRFVVGHAPVNRRTAGAPLREPAPDPVADAQARRLQARHALGVPLAELLPADPPAPRHAPVPVPAVAAAMAGTGLALVAALAPGVWAAAAALGAASGLGLAGWRLWRARRAWAPTAPLRPLLDAPVLAALDHQLTQVLAELRDDSTAAEALRQLKAQLVRTVHAQATARAQGLLPVEDGLFVHECLRRYLPDTLQAYLQVPAAQRQAPLDASGQTASQALQTQLAQLGHTLAELEARAGVAAGQALLQQQAFLQAKTGRRG